MRFLNCKTDFYRALPLEKQNNKGAVKKVPKENSEKTDKPVLAGFIGLFVVTYFSALFSSFSYPLLSRWDLSTLPTLPSLQNPPSLNPLHLSVF